MSRLNHDTSPTVSLVIRCYNEVEHIGELFERLKEQSFRDFETIVVDSGSTDGTLDVVSTYDAKLLHIPKEDFSFGRSLNLGCAQAVGLYFVFISAHCYPMDSDWLSNLVAGFNDPHVAGVYGKQRGTMRSHFSERRIFCRWYPDDSSLRQDGPFFNNANSAIRRDVWKRFPFDEELTGLEDLAWAAKVIRDGWWISYRSDAGVWHFHDERNAQIRHRYWREALTFQKVFPYEHFNLRDFARLCISNIRSDWRAAWEQGLLLQEWWNILAFRIAQFLGTHQGFHMRRPVSSEVKRRFYYPDT